MEQWKLSCLCQGGIGPVPDQQTVLGCHFARGGNTGSSEGDCGKAEILTSPPSGVYTTVNRCAEN